MKKSAAIFMLLASASLSACSSQLYDALPARDAAYALIPAIDKAVAPTQAMSCHVRCLVSLI